MEKINNLVKYLQSTVLEKILNNIPENIKLEKKEINGTIIYKSPEVIAEQYNISRCLYFDKYNETVIEFTKKLEDNFSHCNLLSFYKNMETAEIKDKIEDFYSLKAKRRNAGAFYHLEKNKIQLVTFDFYIHKLFHELLHLAARKKIGEIVFSGFLQIDKNNKKIGLYLNEGYTEYLNQKYFSKKETNHYKKAQIFAQGIEIIVGRKKMEQLYFDANLEGLINELGKYSPKEEIINLINRIDYYYEQLFSDNDNVNEIYSEILSTIANIYRIKLSKELSEGKISEYEYRKRRILYCDEYEDGRVHSDNTIISEINYGIKIHDIDKDEVSFRRIRKTEDEILKVTPFDELHKKLLPDEEIFFESTRRK